mgnify:CR=1 FL=1
MANEWTSVQQVAKDDNNNYVALVEGKWIPVAGAAKDDSGKFMAYGLSSQPKIGRKTGIMEDIGIGLENVAHKGKTALDLLAGAAATYAGYQEDADKIYADMEARQKARESELAGLDQGTGGKIISGVTGIAPAIVAAPLVGVPAALGGMAGMSAFAGGGENVGKGASVPAATAQAMLEAGTDYASLKIPVGRGILQGAALGAGGNVAGTVATDYTGRQLMEGTEAAKTYETTPEKLLVSAATGAIPGGVFGRFNRQGQLEARPTAEAAPDTHFERVLKQEQESVVSKKQPENALNAMDETMQVPLTKMQAPQYGLGGKISKHIDEAGREIPTFEPGERVDQIHMDLERERIAAEERQENPEQVIKENINEIPEETIIVYDVKGNPVSAKVVGTSESGAKLVNINGKEELLGFEHTEVNPVESTKVLQDATQQQLDERLAVKMQHLEELVKSGATNQSGFFETVREINAIKAEQRRRLGGETPSKTNVEEPTTSAKEVLSTEPTPADVYAENIRNTYPEATDEQIQKAWDLKKSEASDAVTEQRETTKVGKIASKLMHQAQRTGEVWTTEKQLEIYPTLDDADISLITENLLSAGSRIQSEIINHPVVTQDINLVNRATDEAGIKAHHVLDDIRTGFFPKIHNFVGTTKDGYTQMKQFVKWMFENEGNPDAKFPDTFDPRVREIYDKYIKGKSDLLKAMNDVLAKDGKSPISSIDNHMVHYWTGPYRAFIYVKGENGKSRLAFPIAERTKADAEKAVAWVKKNVPNIDTKLSGDIKFVGADARSRASTFDLLLDMSNQKDPMVLEALEAFKNRIAASQEKHLGEQFRQKRRGGAEGYLGNKPWLSENANYQDAMDVMRRTFDAGYEWVAAQQVRQAREPILQAQNEGKISVGNALAFGQRYIDHAFGRNMDTSFVTKAMDRAEAASPKLFGTTRRVAGGVHNAANQIIYPWLLAGRLSSSVQAVAQIFLATTPRMLADIQAEGKSLDPKAYVRAGASVGEGLMDGMFQLFNTVSLGKFEKYQNEFYDLAKFKGSKEIAQAIRDMDISRISLSDSSFLKEGGQAKTLANVALKGALNAPMTVMESPFRAWAFSAFARRALKEGYDMPTALAMARENMDSMVNYGRKNSAMALGKLGPVGNEARGLHTFTINMYSQLAHYTTLAARSKNPAPLLAMLAGVYFTAGALGMVGVDLADALIDGVKAVSRGKSWDNPELQNFSMRKWIIESDTPDWNKFGALSANTGLGLYGSFAAKLVDPDRGLLDNLFPKATFGIELGKSAIAAHKLVTDKTLSRGERGQILESIAPKVMTQKIRNEYQNIVQKNPETGESTGATVFSPFKTGPVYQRTAKEQQIAERGLGTRALPEVAAVERERLFTKGEANIRDSKTAAEKGFKDDLEEAFKEQMRGGTVTPEQAENIVTQLQTLQTKWGVTDEALYNSVKKIQDDLDIPDPIMRRLMAIKTPTPNNIREAQSLIKIFKQNRAMQEEYK